MMRFLLTAAIAIALAGCSGSSTETTSAETQPSGGVDPGAIDFGKLMGGQGGAAAGEKGSPPAQGAPAQKGEAYRVKQVKLMDSQGWEQPVEIAHFLLPADWRGQGGANWDQKAIQCVPNIVQTYFGSESADGLSGLDIAPPFTWVSSPSPEVAQLLQQSAAQGGCPMGPAMSAIQYLENTILRRYRSGATVLERLPEPEVAQAKRAQAAPLLDPLRAKGALRDYRVDSGSLHIAYQRNGQPVEEWLSATVLHLATPTPTLSGMQRGVMNDGTQITSLAENVFAIRAPQGKFDKQLAATIIASIRPNPTYQAAVAKFQENMNNTALRGAMDRARIWREAAQEISGIINESYRSQQAAQDRMSAKFSQYIRGVSTYINPQTGQPMEVPSGYSGVWMGSNGEITLSNDPNYNPNDQSGGGGWTPMKPQG